MRLADLPSSVLHGAAEAPILLYRRDWFEVVHPGQITMLHARDKVVEVYTHDGYRGARAGATVVGWVTQYPQCDWVLLSRAVAVKRSAILRVAMEKASLISHPPLVARQISSTIAAQHHPLTSLAPTMASRLQI